MLVTVISAVSANIFTIYPGFIDPQTRVQVATDKGPVVELVIACKQVGNSGSRHKERIMGEGIMSFSKIDQKFCVPDASCYRKFSTAYNQLCK